MRYRPSSSTALLWSITAQQPVEVRPSLICPWEGHRGWIFTFLQLYGAPGPKKHATEDLETPLER